MAMIESLILTAKFNARQERLIGGSAGKKSGPDIPGKMSVSAMGGER